RRSRGTHRLRDRWLRRQRARLGTRAWDARIGDPRGRRGPRLRTLAGGRARAPARRLLRARLGSRAPTRRDRLRSVRVPLDVRALGRQPSVLRLRAARAPGALAGATRTRSSSGPRVPVAVSLRAVADHVRRRPAAADGPRHAPGGAGVERVLL